MTNTQFEALSTEQQQDYVYNHIIPDTCIEEQLCPQCGEPLLTSECSSCDL